MPRSLILFLILSIGIVSSSDILNYTVETEESLGCSQINRHKRFYYEIPENSTIRLPTCRPFQSNSVVFWFSYDEYCRNSFNRNRHFASVFPNGTNLCENQNECRENFRFTSESMIILKTNKQSITQYVCSLNRLTSSSDRPVSYLIRFVIDNDQSSTKPEESTTHDNFSASTYFSSTTISIGSNTVDLSTAGKFFSFEIRGNGLHAVGSY